MTVLNRVEKKIFSLPTVDNLVKKRSIPLCDILTASNLMKFLGSRDVAFLFVWGRASPPIRHLNKIPMVAPRPQAGANTRLTG
jgi:hypothetical protein